jgi:hypothetical protein
MKWILFLMILAIMGCSSEGTLEVYNASNESVEVQVGGNSTEIDWWETETFSWDIENSIFDEGSIDISISGEGLFIFPFTDEIQIEAGENNYYNIEADAGAIEIRNYSGYTISEVYISLSSSSSWGDNLTSYFSNNSSKRWRVEANYYDIKIVDSSGDYGYSWDDYIPINDLEVYNWYGSKSAMQGTFLQEDLKNKSLKLP